MTFRTLATISTVALGTVLVTMHDFRTTWAATVGLFAGFVVSRIK